MIWSSPCSALPEGKLVNPPCGDEWFFSHIANDWVRQFIPKELDNKGLHRLRGLYADAVKTRFGVDFGPLHLD